MAPSYMSVNSEKCNTYGHFLSNVDHLNANAIFWGCFITTLLLLGVVSLLYASFNRRQTHFEQASHNLIWHPELSSSSEFDRAERKKKLKVALHRCRVGSLVCAILMIPIISLEAVAGLNITFCHAEDLIMFYWGPFWLLSVGTLIATWGLFLSQTIGDTFGEEPAWNVALGTPVLVVAGIQHYIHSFLRWTWRQWKERDQETVDPILIPPRYLSHCIDCQQDSHFLYIPWTSGNPSQSSSQHHLTSFAASPARTGRINLNDPSEKLNDEESPASSSPTTPEEDVPTDDSEKGTNQKRPRIRFEEPNSR